MTRRAFRLHPPWVDSAGFSYRVVQSNTRKILQSTINALLDFGMNKKRSLFCIRTPGTLHELLP